MKWKLVRGGGNARLCTLSSEVTGILYLPPTPHTTPINLTRI